MKEWCSELRRAIATIGRSMDLDWTVFAEQMRTAGFVDVHVQNIKIPIGRWPADPQLKEAGTYQLVSLLEGIESISLAPFTRLLGWQKNEMDVLLAKAKKELSLKRACLYWPACVSLLSC